MRRTLRPTNKSSPIMLPNPGIGCKSRAGITVVKKTLVVVQRNRGLLPRPNPRLRQRKDGIGSKPLPLRKREGWDGAPLPLHRPSFIFGSPNVPPTKKTGPSTYGRAGLGIRRWSCNLIDREFTEHGEVVAGEGADELVGSRCRGRESGICALAWPEDDS